MGLMRGAWCVVWLALALAAGAAVPDYRAFRGSGGITIVSNPPTGTIVIDGSAISGSAVPGGSTFSVQYQGTNNFSGDTNFQYVPWHESGGDPVPGKLTLNYLGVTNVMDGNGFGTLSPHTLYLQSGGNFRWSILNSGDFNAAIDNTYNIGTIGLNTRPQYVNAAANFRVSDKVAVSLDTTTLQIGNDATWTEVALITDAAHRLTVVTGGAIGVGTRFPTARFAITNIGMLVPSFVVYGSNQPTPAFIITTNGLIGVGTATPAVKMEVKGTGDTRLRVGTTSASDYTGFEVSDGSVFKGGFFWHGGSPMRVSVLAPDGNALYINNSGHITFSMDDSSDIGAIGAARPRSIYVGTSVLIEDNADGLKLGIAGARSTLVGTGSGVIEFLNNGLSGFNRLQFGGTTAAFPGLGQTNGDLIVLGANGAFDGTSTNRLIAPGGLAANGILLNNFLQWKQYGTAFGWSNTVAGTLSLYMKDSSDDAWAIHGQLDVGETLRANAIYATNDISALTFTDRSKAPDALADAYAIVASVEAKDGHVNHAKLHPLAWGTRKNGRGIVPDQSKRDLGMVVSAQSLVIADLVKRLEALEKK